MEAIFPIRAVTQQTGLSPHVLRIWERRYDAVTPKRSNTNRRLYSEQDIEKLRLLRRLTDQGHSIGQVAGLGLNQLKDLAQQTPSAPAPGTVFSETLLELPTVKNFESHAMQKIKNLDPAGLEQILEIAASELSPRHLLEELLPSLLEKIGALWEKGKLGIAHEHVASTIIRTFLSNMRSAYPIRPNAPRAVFATPPGQDHDLGALLAAKIAASEGWQPLFLGARVPPSELVETVKQSKAKLVGLSVLPSQGTDYLKSEISRLGELLKGRCAWIVGGKGARSLKGTVESAGGRILSNLEEFRIFLKGLA